MGAEVAAGGGGSLPAFLGRKNRYARVGDVLPQEAEDGGGVRVRGGAGSCRRYVFACSVFASLNHVLLGYDVGAMSGCIIFIQRDLHITEVQQEVLVGCLSFISLLGSLAAGRTSDAIGRKWTIGLAAAVFQGGAAIMALAPSFALLMAGRLLAGIGIGIGIMVAPVYISEISPETLRGSLGSLPEIFISFGILIGYVSNLAFAGLPDNINWRVMLAAGILPSISIAFVLLVIPESPRWLVMRGRAGDARAVLARVSDTDEEAEARLAEIEAAAARSTGDGDGKEAWRELLRPSPVIRRMLVTGIGVQFFQQATGIDALVYYSPTIFRDAGHDGAPAPGRHRRRGRGQDGGDRGRHRPRRPRRPEALAVHQHGRHDGEPRPAGGVAVAAEGRRAAGRRRRGARRRDGVRLRGVLLGGDGAHQHGAELGDLPAAAARAGRGGGLRAQQDGQRRRGHVVPLHLPRGDRRGRVRRVRGHLGAVRGVRAPVRARDERQDAGGDRVAVRRWRCEHGEREWRARRGGARRRRRRGA